MHAERPKHSGFFISGGEKGPSKQFVRRDRVEDMEDLTTYHPEFAHVRIERTGDSQGTDYVGIRVHQRHGTKIESFYERLDRVNPVLK